MRARYSHKFRAKPVADSGQHFASKLEHRFFQVLEVHKRAGHVLFFLRQVTFHLPGGVKYVCDYQIFYSDGRVTFVDVKGVETPDFIAKKKIVEAMYPVTIDVIKKGDF